MGSAPYSFSRFTAFHPPENRENGSPAPPTYLRFRHLTGRWDFASKPLALAGVHPYNPLTGIIQKLPRIEQGHDFLTSRLPVLPLDWFMCKPDSRIVRANRARCLLQLSRRVKEPQE